MRVRSLMVVCERTRGEIRGEMEVEYQHSSLPAFGQASTAAVSCLLRYLAWS